MEEYVTLPYDVLEDPNWVVDNLWQISQQGKHEGILLPELVDINACKFNPKKDIEPDKDYIYIEVSNINANAGIIEPPLPITGENLKERAKNIAHAGDILLALIRPQNRNIAVIPDNLDGCIVSNNFAVLTPKKISSELLFLVLRSDSVTEGIARKITGTTIPSINLKHLKDTFINFKSVPIDPDTERMAKKLYYEWISKMSSTNNWEEVASRTLERMLIKKIDEKKILSHQKGFLLPYCDLGDRWDVSYHDILRAEPTVEWQCELKRLDDLASFPRTSADIEEENIEEGVPIVRVRDIQEDLTWLESEGITRADVKARGDNTLLPQDILMVKVGSTAGKVVIAAEGLAGAVTNQHILTLRTTPEILPEYLLLFLKSKWAKFQLNKMTLNVTQSFIQVSELGKLTIPLPNLSRQHEIVEITKKLRAENEVSNLEKRISAFQSNVLVH